jgi:hypothetical protein
MPGFLRRYLVRTALRKPIRVFMQSGSHDFDNSHGSWPLANQTLAQSLHYAGYNYKFVCQCNQADHPFLVDSWDTSDMTA